MTSHTTWANITLPKLDVHGYVDTSYNYLSCNNTFTSGTLVRNNDIEPNGFTLQQAGLTVSSLPEQGLGGLMNVIVGRDANQLSPAGWDPYFGSQTLAIDPAQLYLQYAIQSFTFMAGKFNSLAGYESYNPSENVNFSFSQVATFAEPSTQVGIRSSYKATPTVDLSIGLNNGWETLHHAGRLNTVELSSQWRPSDMLTTSASISSGSQYMTDPLANGPTGTRHFINAFATLNPIEKLSLTLNGDYGIQSKGLLPNSELGRVAWSGVTGYITYHLTERWYSSMRGDLLNDGDGFRTGVRQSLKELTLTLGFKPVKQLVLRAEARHDFSNQNSFVNNNTVSASNNLQSFAFEGLYIFS